jgi:hypothetical protein
MSTPSRAWVAIVVGSGLVVGSVVWLIVSPGVLAAVFLAVGVVVVFIAVSRRLERLTLHEMDLPNMPLRVGESFLVSYRQVISPRSHASARSASIMGGTLAGRARRATPVYLGRLIIEAPIPTDRSRSLAGMPSRGRVSVRIRVSMETIQPASDPILALNTTTTPIATTTDKTSATWALLSVRVVAGEGAGRAGRSYQ